MRKKLICIVGDSGVGKNEIAKLIEKELAIKSIVSYTTRPKRDNEIDGIDYHFVDKCPTDKSNFLEYNNFGKYEYWSDISELKDNAYTFIVEENGLRYLKNSGIDKAILFVIYVKRDLDKRLKSGVDLKRIERDISRKSLKSNEIDYVIENNYDNIEELRLSIPFEGIKDFIKSHIYISLPITDTDIESVYSKVYEIKEYLNNNFYKVKAISPLDIEEVSLYKSYSDYIVPDIRVLLDDIDKVYFCKNWEKSKGCRLEKAVCDNYNIDVLYE